MKPQSTWVTAVYTLSLISIVSLFVVIALQINTSNTMRRQEELLSSMSRDIKDFKGSVDKLVLTGTIILDDIDDLEEPEDDMKMSNDSIISIEEIETFVEDNDIIIDEKIVVHTEKGFSEKVVGQNMELPDLPTDRKVCTNYTVYGIGGTPHNRMQLAAWTDEQGCRRYGDYYIVGLGSAYADRIGETFEVELDTGVTFKIITGDMKADCDTDPTNRYCPCINYDGEQCANILEFIIDRDVLDPKAYAWGGVDWYDNFKGNIVRLTYLGRDESADWDSYY